MKFHPLKLKHAREIKIKPGELLYYILKESLAYKVPFVLRKIIHIYTQGENGESGRILNL
jgi:hypothetical protein